MKVKIGREELTTNKIIALSEELTEMIEKVEDSHLKRLEFAGKFRIRFSGDSVILELLDVEERVLMYNDWDN